MDLKGGIERMKIPSDGKLLRIFIGEQDKWQGQPLYEAIIHLAKSREWPAQRL